jgi:hypothetical protein
MGSTQGKTQDTLTQASPNGEAPKKVVMVGFSYGG